MRSVCLLVIALFASVGVAQQTAPAAAAPSAEAAAGVQTTAPTIRATTQIVAVDVSVLDANGRPVHGLKQGDFTVTENGAPQKVEHFEERSAPAGAAKLPPMPPMGPGEYTNFSFAPTDGPLNVILLDMLNTPLQNQMEARQRIRDFLANFKAGQRVAIFGLSTRLFLLQGFTSDPALLKAALGGKRDNAKTSVLRDEPGMPVVSNELDDAMGNDPGAAEMLANVQQFEALISAEQTRQRALTTLGAMNQLARYLSGLEGRKNLIWVSASFPLNIMPDPTASDPFWAQQSMEEDFRATTNLMTRARVTIYPIDARGVFMTPGVMDATVSGSKFARRPSAYGQAIAKANDAVVDEQTTMYAMADATGGKATVNNNDLAGAVNEALSSGADYYSLTYSPTDHKWDSRYRRIKIVAGNGKQYTLRYRQGYYADDPKAEKGHASTAATTTGHIDALSAAMQRGAPDPIEILFKAKIVPMAATQETVADGNVPQPKVKGPFKTFSIFLACNPGDLGFKRLPDGKHSSVLQFATTVYDADGNPVVAWKKLAQAMLPADGFEQLAKQGMQFQEQISVPAKGNYFLRIGMEDMYSGKVGAIEVPADAVPKAEPALKTR